MIHNNGSAGNVVNLSRLTSLGLEPPPNDTESWPLPPAPIMGLGGRTAPAAGLGSMLPPDRAQDHSLVLTTKAPPDRQDYTKDGGTITATPPASVTRQENQKGVVDIIGDADLKTLKVFKPGQFEDEGV